ncbi:hypothetical protein McanMca71_006931 [Microsporum canis]|uniref:Uncharacterized protein n=1 Tax=Arthroderma otae (strain ATCC MYA-4605 / CBS 113480) TaxID=554155 RepID=C5FBQ7_ARTOC|nr:uncharacterized protein MCYG_00129 [Microsporum canis CBS 113480]EEQ27241.1 predicted protein [Microsporum canis CBS 113480]
MNWTGGRLHRSSYKTKPSSKGVQQQRVAQAKLRVINETQPISPFRITTWATGERESYEAGCPGSIATSREYGTNTRNENQAALLNTSGLLQVTHNYDRETKDSLADSSTTMVDEMRKKLLRKEDWAGLSLSRPYRLNAAHEQDKRRFGRRQPLFRENGFGLHTPQQAPNKRQKMARPRRRSSTQPSSDDISVWVEQQRGEPEIEPHHSEISMFPHESAESILFDTNSTRDRVGRSISTASTRVKGSQNIICNSDIEEQEQYQLDNQTDASLCPDISNIPVLDRRGSFVTTGNQTRYIPPPMPTPQVSRCLEGETRSESSTGRDEIYPRQKRTPPLQPRGNAQSIISRDPKWIGGAGNLIEYPPRYVLDCNSTMVLQRDIARRKRHQNIDYIQNYSLNRPPLLQKYIQPPLYSKSRCSSYGPISSPHLDIQEIRENQNTHQQYYDLNGPTQYVSRYANTEQRQAGFSHSLPKPQPCYSNLSPIKVPNLRAYKVLVYGQEVDLSENDRLE